MSKKQKSPFLRIEIDTDLFFLQERTILVRTSSHICINNITWPIPILRDFCHVLTDIF